MSKSLDSPVKILLADDSVTMHRAVSLALKKESYELICVDNGKDALRLAYEHRPQVVLLDLDMPERTGIEVAREIRSDATLSSIQIVLLCGSFDDINEKDIEKAPVDARLWKPFESHVLLAMLRTLINARAKSSPGPEALQSVAAEATAPQAKPPLPAPPKAAGAKPPPRPPVAKLPTPKSRKEEAILDASIELEDRAETLPESSREKLVIHEALEATRPLQVSDLFDPQKRSAPLAETPLDGITSLEQSSADDGDDGDFTRELARETFGASAFPEELPEPLAAIEETAPLPTQKREKPAQPSEPREPQISAQPKEDPFVANLWSPEELSSYEEETSFSASDPSHEESNPLHTYSNDESESASSTGELDFEILDPHAPDSEALTSAHQSDMNTSPWDSTPLEVPQPFEHITNEATREVHSTLRERIGGNEVQQQSAPSVAPDELRRMISEEIKRAFHSWLRDELQRQLNDVMSELDSELS